MKQITLLALLLVLFATGCADDDDDGGFFNRIAQIGRAEGWKLDAVVSDYGMKVNDAIDNLTEEQIAADPRTREELRDQYTNLVRVATVVDECDRDDLLFFVENGALRIIQGDVACGADGDPNPIAGFNDRTYTVNTDADEMTIRANSGAFLGTYVIQEVNSTNFNFERNVTVGDSIFTNLTYSIRYEMIAN